MAVVSCGVDSAATGTFGDGPEGGLADSGVTDAFDAGRDAESAPPDAAVAFAPSHIHSGYSLAADPVTIDVPTVVDTTALTIMREAGPAVVSPNMVASDGVAVWSVGSLTTNAMLTVTGDRPLVIVSRDDVVIQALVQVSASGGRPGAGGSAPATGSGRGLDGAKSGDNAAGGGGAGHGTAGGKGGNQSPASGGVAGPATNATGVLTGGSGGGHGGGFDATRCAGHGRGGAGGGALQISAIGKIIIRAGGIAAGGGGGDGGCKNDGEDKYTGGGGGGAGGLLFLESVEGIDLVEGATLAASGGAGGEGGDAVKFGDPGDDGPYPVDTAGGGSGATGGNGGDGGNAALGLSPEAGRNGGDSAGGGGGATGRLFLRTRGAKLVIKGIVSAQRTDDPTF